MDPRAGTGIITQRKNFRNGQPESKRAARKGRGSTSITATKRTHPRTRKQCGDCSLDGKPSSELATSTSSTSTDGCQLPSSRRSPSMTCPPTAATLTCRSRSSHGMTHHRRPRGGRFSSTSRRRTELFSFPRHGRSISCYGHGHTHVSGHPVAGAVYLRSTISLIAARVPAASSDVSSSIARAWSARSSSLMASRNHSE